MDFQLSLYNLLQIVCRIIQNCAQDTKKIVVKIYAN
jgi:hypothetical protein